MKLSRFALIVFLGMTGTAMLSHAAENAPAKPEAGKPAARQSAGKGTADGNKKARRLPAGYGLLGLNDGQREQVYSVQSSYQSQIDKLRAELAQLAQQRDAKMEAVLTPGQKARLQELRAESKANSEKAAAKQEASK